MMRYTVLLLYSVTKTVRQIFSAGFSFFPSCFMCKSLKLKEELVISDCKKIYNIYNMYNWLEFYILIQIWEHYKDPENKFFYVVLFSQRCSLAIHVCILYIVEYRCLHTLRTKWRLNKNKKSKKKKKSVNFNNEGL